MATKKQHSSKFKARVAAEAIRGEKTLSQLSSQFGVHAMQIAYWRRLALDQMSTLFMDGRQSKERENEVETEALYEEIGRLKMELDWVKKKLASSSKDRRGWVEGDHPRLSVRRQCELLGINRASLYYRRREESEGNLRLMRLIDRQYTRVPFYGRRRMTAWLRSQGWAVNRKRVGRLMGVMGIEAVYPKPKLSARGKGHQIYPYLLRGVEVERADQVWCADITYIPMGRGVLYLAAVMDWFSRYVLSWALSLTMEEPFCLEALKGALRRGQPEVFNTDQGSQFTSEAFRSELEARQITISMDGRGRCLDNIFIERLWRSLKYEEVYLREYATVWEARAGIGRYFDFYNHQRLHQSLDYRTPAALYRIKEKRGD